MAVPAVGARTALPVASSADHTRSPERPAAAVAPARGHARLSGLERNVSQARDFVRDLLGAGNPLSGTACLIVSELVTNAVQHSRSGRPGGIVNVTLREVGAGVRIEVADEGAHDSIPRVKADCWGTSGRGLLLVAALADSWGYIRDRHGTTVWCDLTT